MGNVDNIPEFLNKIDICVVPSRSEGFGLALVEAMAMGVPCVASNIAGPREIVMNEGIGELFENGNSQSLSMKIEEVISKYDEIKKAPWNQKLKVKQNYSIEHMCTCLLEIYTEK